MLKEGSLRGDHLPPGACRGGHLGGGHLTLKGWGYLLVGVTYCILYCIVTNGRAHATDDRASRDLRMNDITANALDPRQ